MLYLKTVNTFRANLSIVENIQNIRSESSANGITNWGVIISATICSIYLIGQLFHVFDMPVSRALKKF